MKVEAKNKYIDNIEKIRSNLLDNADMLADLAIAYRIDDREKSKNKVFAGYSDLTKNIERLKRQFDELYVKVYEVSVEIRIREAE